MGNRSKVGDFLHVSQNGAASSEDVGVIISENKEMDNNKIIKVIAL